MELENTVNPPALYHLCMCYVTEWERLGFVSNASWKQNFDKSFRLKDFWEIFLSVAEVKVWAQPVLKTTVLLVLKL